MSAINKITAQQEKLTKGSAAWVVGEQLKDICRREPAAEELLDRDLDVPEMDLKHAEAKIKAYADKHKTGNFAFVAPETAEEILREFYGLHKGGAASPAPEKAEGGRRKIIDLGAFL